MKNKPTDEEIDAVINECADNENDGKSKFPGMTYDQGVRAAIEWMQTGENNPME